MRLVPTPALALLAPGLLLSSFALHAGIDVRIEGIDGEVRQNVELRLGIATQRGSGAVDEALVSALHVEALDDIHIALQPFGYYNAVVDGSLSGQGADWVARYRIDPGPRTLIATADVRLVGEGAVMLVPVRDAILRDLRPGAPLLHADYEKAKSRLAAVAYANGYLDARITRAELRVLADENRADVLLEFDTGPRYYFGPVVVEQDILDPGFIDRYVTIGPGDPYDPKQLLDTQFALGDLGYFASIEVLPQRDAAVDNGVPIRIATRARKPVLYNYGAGYGTDTGARVSAGVQMRRLNRSGHTAEVETRVSELKSAARGLYRIPLGDRVGESVGLAGELATEQFPDGGESRKWGVELSLSRIPGKWKRKLYVAFTHEASELGNTVQTADLLTPGVSFNRTDVDDPAYARSGWAAFTDVHGAVRDVLANTSFVRGQTVLRGVLPAGERARVLGRFEYGANFVEAFGELPASQRFFAGGDQSVRGYKYQSLGPKDADGNVIGGKFLQTFSLELETQLWSRWGAAVFYDAGGADDDPTPKLYQGVGIGARYRSPVGSVQVDLAHPLDGDVGGVRLHLGVRVGL